MAEDDDMRDEARDALSYVLSGATAGWLRADVVQPVADWLDTLPHPDRHQAFLELWADAQAETGAEIYRQVEHELGKRSLGTV